jgi:hypothetical protein
MVIVVTAFVELGLIVTELGVKLTDAPVGSPEAERLTFLGLIPLTYVKVTVAVTLLPAGVEPLDGETDTKKAKKLAVTLFGPSMVRRTEFFVPAADPIQQSKAKPDEAKAVNVTEVPLS